MDSKEIHDLTIKMKWAGNEYLIAVQSEDTVAVLRHEIFKQCDVLPIRQKLINLKHQGKPAGDDVKLCDIEIKPNFQLLMIGSTEKEIENACMLPKDLEEVTDDFDYETDDKIIASSIFQAKIQRRIREYKIKELNTPAEGKRLLVLDVDYTLFDHRSVGEQMKDLMRPYLHEFLTAVNKYYNIVIWSATAMRWIEQKMNMLGVSSNHNYKIWFYLDSNACISINANLSYNHQEIFDTKPLDLIWGKYPQYNSKNTLIIDDIKRNFVMNPQSGLKIKPFKHSVWSPKEDRELLKLSVYLANIALNCSDFNNLNHNNWHNYKPAKD